MNLTRFDYMVADYLEYLRQQGYSWETIETISQRIADDIHSIINSPLWDDKWMED